MIKLNYVHEKFLIAVDNLATSPADIRLRLKSAFISMIALQPRDFDEFPELKRQFEELKDRVTRIKDNVAGDLSATLNSLDDGEASEVAEIIFSMFLDIREIYQRSLNSEDDTGRASSAQ